MMGDPLIWVLMAVVVTAVLLASDARRDSVFLASAVVMILGAAAIGIILVDENSGAGTFRMIAGDELFRWIP